MHPLVLAAAAGVGLLVLASGSRSAAPLLAIVPGARLLSGFGSRTVRGQRQVHLGVDLAAPWGTPVLSPVAGTVVGTWVDGQLSGAGNTISLQHDDGRHGSLYMHLSRIDVRRGARVARGELLGAVGSTDSTPGGFARSGSHLHFEVMVSADPQAFAHFNGRTPTRRDPFGWAPAAHVRLA